MNVVVMNHRLAAPSQENSATYRWMVRTAPMTTRELSTSSSDAEEMTRVSVAARHPMSSVAVALTGATAGRHRPFSGLRGRHRFFPRVCRTLCTPGRMPSWLAVQSRAAPESPLACAVASSTVSYTHLRAHETRHDL